MGKFSRSWELVKQSFAILRSDKQLMLFPVLSAIACLIVTAIIATGGAFLMLPAMTSAAAAGERFNPNQSPTFLLGMFSLYVANYFVIVFFNVALVGVANSRLMGGTWTFEFAEPAIHSAMALAELANRAGVPAGIFNVVPSTRSSATAIMSGVIGSPTISASDRRPLVRSTMRWIRCFVGFIGRLLRAARSC
jgi:hypothetical protein